MKFGLNYTWKNISLRKTTSETIQNIKYLWFYEINRDSITQYIANENGSHVRFEIKLLGNYISNHRFCKYLLDLL